MLVSLFLLEKTFKRAADDLRSQITAGRAEMARALATGPCGRAATAALSAVYDRIVTTLWHAAIAASPHADERDVALVAAGSWGRREMCPYSDIDFLLLTANKRSDRVAREISDRLLYPLWDAGIKVVPSVDDPESRARLARTDLPTATGLLDIRHLAGNPALSTALVHATRRHVSPTGNANRFLDQLASNRRRRHDRFGARRSTHRPPPGRRTDRGLPSAVTSHPGDHPHRRT